MQGPLLGHKPPIHVDEQVPECRGISDGGTNVALEELIALPLPTRQRRRLALEPRVGVRFRLVGERHQRPRFLRLVP